VKFAIDLTVILEQIFLTSLSVPLL